MSREEKYRRAVSLTDLIEKTEVTLAYIKQQNEEHGGGEGQVTFPFDYAVYLLEQVISQARTNVRLLLFFDEVQQANAALVRGVSEDYLQETEVQMVLDPKQKFVLGDFVFRLNSTLMEILSHALGPDAPENPGNKKEEPDIPSSSQDVPPGTVRH